MLKRRIDQLAGVLNSPAATLREVANEAPVGVAICVLLLGSLGPLIAPDQSDAAYLGQLGLAQARWTSWGMNLLVTILLLVAVHWLARTYVAAGTWKGFIAAFGFAAFPRLLSYPLLILVRTPLEPLARLGSLGLSLWVLVLSVLAVRESYQLRTRAAVLTYILAAICSAIVVGLVVAISLMAGAVRSL